MPNQMKNYKLNAGKVIDLLGGPVEIEGWFKARGKSITRHAIRKWRTRKMIPMEVWLLLVVMARAKKIDLSLRDFTITETAQ